MLSFLLYLRSRCVQRKMAGVCLTSLIVVVTFCTEKLRGCRQHRDNESSYSRLEINVEKSHILHIEVERRQEV